MCWVSTARKGNKFQFQQVDAVLYGQLYSSSTNILHCRHFSLLVVQWIEEWSVRWQCYSSTALHFRIMNLTNRSECCLISAYQVLIFLLTV
jgi:hypothetical protein